LATERVVRRLAAILAADVEGQPPHGCRRGGGLARLRAYRRELLAPKIDKHRGRVVKTTGDGLRIEFPSLVDAVRGAARYSARWDAIAPMPR
jgi:adenylate cyclase